MIGCEFFPSFEVGYRPGDLEYPVVGACGKAELPDRMVQQVLSRCIQLAVPLEMPRFQLRI